MKKSGSFKTLFNINSAYAFFIVIILYSSCTKLDVSENTDIKPKGFFDLPQNAHPALKKVVLEFERQDSLTSFIKDMVLREGIPVWEKSQIIHFRGKGTFARDDDYRDVIEILLLLYCLIATTLMAFSLAKLSAIAWHYICIERMIMTSSLLELWIVLQQRQKPLHSN